MRKILFIFIAFAVIGCNYKIKDNKEVNVLPVTATLTYIDCTWFESPELNKKAGIADNMKTVYLNFTLSNPNDYPVYIPIYSYLRDSMYSSNIGIYLKGQKLYTEKHLDRLSPIIGNKGKRFFCIKIWDLNENNMYENSKDVRNIILDLEFRYARYDSDSIYHKMKVGDIKFIIDEELIINYRDPETVNEDMEYI